VAMSAFLAQMKSARKYRPALSAIGSLAAAASWEALFVEVEQLRLGRGR
jgi:hypothetical protein